MGRKSDLESHIRGSYDIIRQYEEIERVSDRPEEKARARRNIEEQWERIQGYLRQYQTLCQRMGASMASDVQEVAIHFESQTAPATAPKVEAPRRQDRPQGARSENSVTPPTCFDLEVRIHARDAGDEIYPVEAQLGAGGHFTDGALRLDQAALRATALDPQKYGQRLSNALFIGPMRDAYLRASTYAETLTENCLRLRLWIDREATELHVLPWELLRVDDVLLAASAATPFSRYLPATTPWETEIAARPLRVLAVISNPKDLAEYRLAPLNVEAERALLAEALEDRDVQIEFLDPPVTLARLEAKLRGGCHILHYLGHGAVSKKQHQPALYLQSQDESTALVGGNQLAAMLARQGVRPHLVVLSACESATVATEDAYAALGPQLIQRGVPAVVAMRGKITQHSARIFNRTLYTRLLAHGVVDLAMNEARSILLTEGRADAAGPVLFMRLKDGRLWDQPK